MKKIILTLICAVLAQLAGAQTFSCDGISYAIIDSTRTCVVSNYIDIDISGEVIIPDVVKYGNYDYEVVGIAARAFAYCEELTSIRLPATITTIGDCAFMVCSGLESVNVPQSVISIGNNAFQYCRGLKHIELPKTITSVPVCAFESSGLTSIDIPESVTSIGDRAFSYSSLTSIEIPGSVTSIGDRAFSGCNDMKALIFKNGGKDILSIDNDAFIMCPIESLYLGRDVKYKKDECPYERSLRVVTIGKSVTIIDDYAFCNCSSIKNIDIPESVTSIGDRAFVGCSGLTKAEFASIESLCNINFESDVSNPLYYARHLYIKGTEIINLVIPESVTSIGNYAFIGCSGLESVKVPQSVTSIGDHAFDGCESLKSVESLGSVTSIGEYAFTDCSSLTSIEIPGSVTSIGKCAFSGCNGMKALIFKDGGKDILTIDNNAFKMCPIESLYLGRDVKYKSENVSPYPSSLSVVTIGKSVTIIDDYAFYNCSSIQTIDLPESVASIGDRAFDGCEGLTCIEIPGSVIEIGVYAFSRCNGINTLIFREGGEDLLYVGGGVFHMCPIESLYLGRNVYSNGSSYSGSLKEATIGRNVTIIGSYIFYECSNLTSIEIPGSVTSIGDNAFSGCTGLTSIEIPESVTEINSFAFYGCTFKHIELPKSLTRIGSEAFRQCNGLTSIDIPGSVTTIGHSAFNECRSLRTLTFRAGEGQLYIYNLAFDNCPIRTLYLDRNVAYATPVSPLYLSLENVTIGKSVTTIGDYAFFKCRRLTSIDIPESVTSIGKCAFSGCESVKSVEILGPVTSIGWKVFNECSKLSSIEIPESVTSIGEYAFTACSSLTSIEIPGSVTSIGKCAFSGCNGMKALIFKDGGKDILTIDNNAFYMCPIESLYLGRDVKYKSENVSPYTSSLSVVTIGKSVTIIDDYAFYNCSSIQTIDLPESVTSIGKSAFEGCEGLTCIEIPGSVTEIGTSAFYRCTGVNALIFRAGGGDLFSVDNTVFNSCPIESLYLDRNVEFVMCPYSNSLKEATIGRNVTIIGARTFAECSKLTSIEIPESVTSIGESAFEGCKCLLIFNIIDGDNDLSIENNSFTNCRIDTLYFGRNIHGGEISEIKNLVISHNVREIGSGVFSNALNIESIKCNSLTPPVFSGTTYFHDSIYPTCRLIVPEEARDYYMEVKPWMYFFNVNSANGTELVWPQEFRCAVGETVELNASNDLGDTVGYTSLTPDGGFRRATIYEEDGRWYARFDEEGAYILRAHIGDQYIEKRFNVVSDHTGLMEYDGIYYRYMNSRESALKVVRGYEMYEGDYVIPARVNGLPVEKIDDFAFYSCNLLNSIVIMDGVKSIGSQAFGNGTLSTISIPPSVAAMTEYAFNAIRGNALSTINLYASTPVAADTTTFNGFVDYEQCVLHVPQGSLAAYGNAEIWENFVNIVDDLPGSYTIEIEGGDRTVEVGETLYLNAIIAPENPIYQAFWESRDPEIATVSEDGRFYAMSEGHTTITARTGLYSTAVDIEVLGSLSTIDTVGADEMKISVENHTVIVRNIPLGTVARLMGIDGVLISSQTSTGSDIRMDLSLAGVYILAVGDHIYKLMVNK